MTSTKEKQHTFVEENIPLEISNNDKQLIIKTISKNNENNSNINTYLHQFINYICSFTYPYSLYSKSLYLYHKYIASNEDANISQITKHIYIGNLSSAMNNEVLEIFDINYILTAIWDMPRVNELIYSFHVDMIDVPQTNIIKHIENSNKFIDYAIQEKKNILIHCICGVSRSVTLLIAYFIYKYQIPPTNVLAYIKTKRPIANPNHGFLHQLEKYYQYVLNNNKHKNVKKNQNDDTETKDIENNDNEIENNDNEIENKSKNISENNNEIKNDYSPSSIYNVVFNDL
tara:strand:- start:2690 stop:3550 length:861 start_codon:yes stop_codon:yes gene_type:complete